MQLYESFEKQEETGTSSSLPDEETETASTVTAKAAPKDEGAENVQVETADSSERKSFMNKIRQNNFEYGKRVMPKISEVSLI